VLDDMPNAIFAVTAGAGQWISISYFGGGGAPDSGMKVDGTQHTRLKASPPHTCHLAHQTHDVARHDRSLSGSSPAMLFCLTFNQRVPPLTADLIHTLQK